MAFELIGVVSAYKNSGSGTSLTATPHANTQNGDIILSFLARYHYALDSITDDWNEIADNGDVTYGASMHYRIPSANPTASVTYSYATATNFMAVLLATFRGGFDSNDPIADSNITHDTVADGVLRAYTVTVPEDDCPLFYWGYTLNRNDYDDISWTPPQDFTEIFDAEIGTKSGTNMTGALELAWKLSESGSTGTISSTPSAIGPWGKTRSNASLVVLNKAIEAVTFIPQTIFM